MKKILLIDNYDSFTYNLKHTLQCNSSLQVDLLRNDQFDPTSIALGEYVGIVIGPGPGSPEDEAYFGNCMKLIQSTENHKTPILGVCLGFQGIGIAFGHKLVQSKVPVHGKTSAIDIVSSDVLYAGLGTNITVMRYHSLMLVKTAKGERSLDITGWVNEHEQSTKNNGFEIMSLSHKSLPIFGVQYHPESFDTKTGAAIVRNFLAYCINYKMYNDLINQY